MKDLTLGIDLGTTKIALVLFHPHSPEKNRILSRASGAALPGAPESAQQDYRKMEETVFDLLSQFPRQELERVGAIGVTGQMHSVVLWNETEISPVTTWQDRSAGAAGVLESFRQRSSCPLADGFGAVTLALLALRGELAKWQFCGTPADLLAVRMTGPNRSAEMDPTFAASWGIYDPETKDWKQKAVRALGIPPALLPAVKPSGSIAGWTQHVPGLPDGVPLLLPLGDNQASIFATAEDPDRELFLTIGTGAQLSCTTDGRIPLPRCTELRPYLRGQQLATTAPLCGGRAWAWLGDTVNAMLKELGLPPFPEKELLNRLDEMAFRAEKASPLTVSPHFLGERNAPSLRGSIEGITLNNLTLPNLAAGLARGIIRQLAEGIPDGLRNGRERIIGSGNGLRLCRFLQQAVEEEFHLPLLFRDLREEAATGAARLAAEKLDSPVR